MAKGITDSKHYTDIAAAIRGKNGKETKYTPSEMAAAIYAISCGKTITGMTVYEESGLFTATYEDGTTVNGSVTFDSYGDATSLTDDAGNSVRFSVGRPVGATDSDGNMVSVYWG